MAKQPLLTEKDNLFENLRTWLLQLPGVSEAPHRFGGTEFQLEGVEFMHSHGHSFLDIRLSKEDQSAVLKTGEALPHRFAPQAGWVSLRMTNPEYLVAAKKIVQLAYENAKKNLREIATRRTQKKLS